MSYKHLFFNDYSEGAHPSILAVLSENNSIQQLGYGADAFTEEATSLIRERCDKPGAAVHLVSGGTQANLVVCAALLKPSESVIAAATGHICVHEIGAIESTGHKVHHVPHINGKIEPNEILKVVKSHSSEHMVRPRIVFISQATELGTVYTRDELARLSEVCRSSGLLLYVDGARLPAALASTATDLTLRDMAHLTDAFYIGGTKCGALFGEAIVVCSEGLAEDFRFHLKQRGALLAKGRFLGLQFRELLRDDLMIKLSRHAVEQAHKLALGIEAAGYRLLCPVATNQIFPVLPDDTITRLQERFGFYIWERLPNDYSAIRLVTSWATPPEAVDAFLSALA
jgi:threonine aldolase